MENPLIDKIEKLLRLGQSSNQFEAEAAILKAQKLALEHNIDLARCSVTEKDKEAFAKEIIAEGSRVPVLYKFVAPILVRFFEIRCIKSTRNRDSFIFFVGRKNNLDEGKFIYNFLIFTFYKLWKETGLPAHQKLSFCKGLQDGLWGKLAEAERTTLAAQEMDIQNKFALMVKDESEALKNALSTLFRVKVKFQKPKKTMVNSSTYQNGVERGRGIEINKSLAR
jgi:Protein of unknown function (DUF2786)